MRLAATAALLCAACDPTVPNFVFTLTRDAGPSLGPPGLNPPAAPALATLTPCPTGWREVNGPEPLDTVTCEPWPDGGYVRCPEDEAHFPGTPGCARIGSACPAGDFPEGLPAGRPVRYVKPGAPAGGTGSMVAPFATIATALNGAASTTIIALAKGAYTETVALPSGITLWGACVSGTTLGRAAASTVAEIGVIGTGTAVRNLKVSSSSPGIFINGPYALELHDVVLANNQVVGLLVFTGAQVTGDHVVIRGTRRRAQGDYGQGLEAGGGATVDLNLVLLDGNSDRAVLASEANTRVHLTDVAVRSTDETAGNGGRALSAHTGATIEVERAALEESRESAVYAEDGAQLVLKRTLVRNVTFSRNQPDNGIGISVTNARATLSQVSIENARTRGLWVVSGARAELADVVIRDTREMSGSRKDGQGMLVSLGATARAERVAFERNRKAGVDTTDGGIELIDVVVRGTLAQVSDGFEGQAIAAQSNSPVTVTRGLFERNTCAGLVADGVGSRLTLTDVQVLDTQPCPDGFDGTGLVVQQGGTAIVERAVFERNASDGIFVALDSTLEATDVVCRDETGEREIGQLGNALHVQQRATVKLTRALFERNREVSVFVVDHSHVEGTDVYVLDGRESACPATRCLARGGVGIAVVDDSTLKLSQFEISRHAALGLYLGTGGVADLSDGVFRSNPIAAAVVTDGFDISRIDQRVQYLDNGRKLDSTVVPLPNPVQMH